MTSPQPESSTQPKGQTYRPVRSWKNVLFDGHLHYETVEQVIHAAQSTGYPYFTWGSDVFITPEKGSWAEKLVCKVHELI